MAKLYLRSKRCAIVCNTQAKNTTDSFKKLFCENGNTHSIFLIWGISIPVITIILLPSLFANQGTCNTSSAPQAKNNYSYYSGDTKLNISVESLIPFCSASRLHYKEFNKSILKIEISNREESLYEHG